ncbi:hypothetical protein DPQ33_20040 [Oceanidesulfovibrio indonesiensis]|uniref:Uncharacterized protein n=1 Tax=Oceanidesulfovibrio indonesiensis TaxID=54767 RepID=A0A7M3M8Z6_9BACT|nr:hypothetical protein DPQ33_20040 [Oceanidesulfovibrio indonesiensis]
MAAQPGSARPAAGPDRLGRRVVTISSRISEPVRARRRRRAHIRRSGRRRRRPHPEPPGRPHPQPRLTAAGAAHHPLAAARSHGGSAFPGREARGERPDLYPLPAARFG